MLGNVSILGNSSRPYVGAPVVTETVRVSSPAMDRPKMSAEAERRVRQVVEAHYDFIWRALRGLGVSSAGADDATQQVFWIASQKLDAISLGSERAFLFATARGIASNARRSYGRNREQVDEQLLAAQVDRGPTPEEAAANNQARRLLERLLDEMPEDLREVFVLFELEGMTTPAIAQILGLPAGTVASRLRRAREDFARQTERLQQSPCGGAA